MMCVKHEYTFLLISSLSSKLRIKFVQKRKQQVARQQVHEEDEKKLMSCTLMHLQLQVRVSEQDYTYLS